MEPSVTADSAYVGSSSAPPRRDLPLSALRPRRHPCPGVIARTELLGVARSPESRWHSEWMRVVRAHPTTDLPNSATNAAGVTSQGGDRTAMGGCEASGPGAPSSPGPHPDRAGGGDNNPVHGADGHAGARRGPHPTTGLPRNDRGAVAVTSKRPDRGGGPQRPGRLPRVLRGPTRSAHRRTLGGRQVLHPQWGRTQPILGYRPDRSTRSAS